MQQSTYQQPVQQSTYQQPVQQSMQQPAYQQPAQQPTYQQPSYQQPSYQPPPHPTYQAPQPSYQQPAQQNNGYRAAMAPPTGNNFQIDYTRVNQMPISAIYPFLDHNWFIRVVCSAPRSFIVPRHQQVEHSHFQFRPRRWQALQHRPPRTLPLFPLMPVGQGRRRNSHLVLQRNGRSLLLLSRGGQGVRLLQLQNRLCQASI